MEIATLAPLLVVVLFGALSVLDLPIQLTPDISIPTLTVRTSWPGASPTEIESEILEPQEDALKGCPSTNQSVYLRPTPCIVPMKALCGVIELGSECCDASSP